MAHRAPLTRQLFWGGVGLVVLSSGLLVGLVGVRRSWPVVALGLAVACWFTFSWLLDLPLRGGACASVMGAGEMGYGPGHPCNGLVNGAGYATMALLLAIPVLVIAGVVTIIRRLIRAAIDIEPV